MFAEQYFTMPKKNPAQISLFPEPQYDYQILLSPPETVKTDVGKLKELLDSLIGIGTHNFTPAHLTLHTLEAPESVNIKEVLKTALAGQRKFTIKIDGYDYFSPGNERVLYLKVENPEPVATLAAIVKAPHKAPVKTERQTSILDRPKRAAKLTFVPHITIARSIPAERFESIIDFSAFEYKGEWLCDRVTVIRRRSDNTGRFVKYAEIKLK